MNHRLSLRHKGFSLVELLVGMAIGLVVTLIIYQVMSTFEGIKRTTTTGSGTQINGAFSLTAIERDIRAAGYGMPTADIMPCTAYFTYSSTAGSPVAGFSGTPVRITSGGNAAGASDGITVLWGDSVRSNVRNILTQTVQLNPNGGVLYDAQASTNVAVSGLGGFYWLTDDVGNCALLQRTNAAGGLVIQHAAAAASAGQPIYNPPNAAGAGWATTYNTNPRVFDTGALTQRSYSVVNGALTSQDAFTTTDNIVLATNIVALKAQYGISNPGVQDVSAWVGATGAWAAPSAANFKRIKAIRFAVVARSPLSEKPAVAGGACATTTVAPTSWPAGPAIDLSNDPNWRCYRYRVFQTIVPLRNVLWANLS